MAFRLRFREISTPDLLKQYQDLTRRYIEVEFPEEYLARSKVIALVSERGSESTILGGFLIAQKGPFRVLQQIPKDVVEQNKFLQDRLHRTLEITGLWIHPLMTAGSLRCRLWFQLFVAVVQEGLNGKTYFVYSYDASKKKLGELYSIWKPQRIFEGLVFIHGMRGSTREIVEIASLHSAVFAFFFKPLFFAKRLFKKILLPYKAVSEITR